MIMQRLVTEAEKAWWQFWKPAEPVVTTHTFSIHWKELAGAIIVIAAIVVIVRGLIKDPKALLFSMTQSCSGMMLLLALGLGVVVGLFRLFGFG